MKKLVLIGLFASCFSLILPAQAIFYPEDEVVLGEETRKEGDTSSAASSNGSNGGASINAFVSSAFGASRNASSNTEKTAPKVDPAFASLTPQQQINSIKMKTDIYLFSEFTAETWEEALDNAKSLLNSEIEQYVKSVGLKDSVVGVIARASNKMMQLKAMRGSRYRAFVYVKKAELIPYLAGEEVMIVSIAKNDNDTPAFDPAKADEEARMKEAEHTVSQAEIATAQQAAAEKARQEAVERQRIAEERARQEAAERQRIAEDRARQEAAERQRIAEEKARQEAAERQRIAEEKARQEAAERQRIAEDRARQEAAERQRIAEEKARQEAAEKAAMQLTDIERDMLNVTSGADIQAFVKGLSNANAIVAFGKFSDMPANTNCLLFVYNRDKEIVAYLRKTGNTYFNLQTKQPDSITNYKGCGAIWFQPK